MTNHAWTCHQNSIVRLALALTLVGLLLAGCAAHHADQGGPESTTGASVATHEQEDPSQGSEPSRIRLTAMDEKTVITLPFDKSIDISPRYEHPHLVIDFDPALPDLILPDPVQDQLINDLSLHQAETGSEAFTSLDITLDKRVQFLISRPTQSSVRILLVPKPERTAQRTQKSHDLPRLQDIRFTHDEQSMFYIKLFADRSFSYRPQPSPADKIAFSFPKLSIPQAFAKLYRLHKFQTPVKNAYLSRSSTGGQLTVSSSHRVPVSIDRQGSTLVIGFKTDGAKMLDEKTSPAKPETSQTRPEQATEQGQAAEQENSLQTTLFPGMKANYTGRKISIDLQDADVEHVLRLVAEVGGYNLILDQSVSGKISLKLDEVPWDQALDLVLLQRNLGMIKRGNILRIAPAQKLEEEQNRMIEARKAAIEAKKSEEELAPLKTEYIQVNYTTASQLESQVKKFLSSRGEVSQDSRTNQLIINDTAKVIGKVRSVVRKLDRAERQVLIEARIVFATDTFQRKMGISWSGNYSFPDSDGDYTRSVGGTIGNLPALGTNTFTLTPSLAKIAGVDTFFLDAQLQLGETQNQVKTVSSPRILTLNNQQAEIQQGIKIATKTESESGGTTTDYQDATLKLSVTPQITPDDKLILTLDITDDSPVGGGEDIETRSTKTQLIANNEETIVIGGVQKVDETQNENNVPGASEIPLLSWLFKNEFASKEKRELLIFIRPKII